MQPLQYLQVACTNCIAGPMPQSMSNSSNAEQGLGTEFAGICSRLKL
jgi:hypothetical protein